MLHRFTGPSFSVDVHGYGVAEVTLRYYEAVHDIEYTSCLYVSDKTYLGKGSTLRDSIQASINSYRLHQGI